MTCSHVCICAAEILQHSCMYMYTVCSAAYNTYVELTLHANKCVYYCTTRLMHKAIFYLLTLHLLPLPPL